MVFVAQSPSMACSSTLHLASPESVTRIITKVLRRSHETAWRLGDFSDRCFADFYQSFLTAQLHGPVA